MGRSQLAREESHRLTDIAMLLIDDGTKLEIGGIGLNDERLIGIRIVEQDFFCNDSLDFVEGLLAFVRPRNRSLFGELGEGS